MSDTPETADISEDGRERIAKRLARAGVCSRRDAEKLIAEGRVALNGTPVETPATLVGPDDEIVVDGNPVAGPEPTRLWRMHKPPGLVTTAKDPEGRPTVFDSLPPELPRVVSVGRLDLNSEGLLLLTNDGALSRFLEMPATGWTRRYRVRVHGYVDEAALKRLEGGITVAGVKYGPIEAALDRQVGANAWLTVGIKEGKNREVRKVLEAIGYTVSRLIRVAYGPFQLGKLAEGAVEEVPRRILREQIPAFFGKGGPALAPDRAKPAPAERTQRAVPGVVPEPKPVRAPEPEPRPRPMPRPRRAGMDEDEAPRRDRAAPAGRARYARADDEGAAQSRPTLRLRTAQTRRDDGSEPGYGVRRPRTRPDAERPRPQGPAERDAPRGRFGGERGEGGEGPRGRAERPRFERDGGDRPAPRGRSARPEREAAERGPPRSPSRGPARGENRSEGRGEARSEGRGGRGFGQDGERPAGRPGGKPGGRPGGARAGGARTGAAREGGPAEGPRGDRPRGPRADGGPRGFGAGAAKGRDAAGSPKGPGAGGGSKRPAPGGGPRGAGGPKGAGPGDGPKGPRGGGRKPGHADRRR